MEKLKFPSPDIKRSYMGSQNVALDFLESLTRQKKICHYLIGQEGKKSHKTKAKQRFEVTPM